MVTALMVPPNGHPTITQLVDDGKFLDRAVSVDTDYQLTASALKIETGIIALHSDEGMLLTIQPNRRIGKKIIAGTFYIVGIHKGNLRSLTDQEIARFTLRFWDVEIHTEDEVFDSWFPVT